MKQQFAYLLKSPQGILLNDGVLSVMVAHEYRGSQARINITLRNVGAADIVGLSPSIVCSPPEALRSQLSKIPQMLGAGGQSQTQLMVECMMNYASAPIFQLNFASAAAPGMQPTPSSYEIPLPCPCFKFMEQMPMQPQDFATSWAKMNAPGLEQSAVFSSSNPSSPINPTLVAQELASLNIAIIPTAEAATCGAAILRTGTAGAGGQKISVGCLVRVEVNPQAGAFRCTVRTATAPMSSLLLDTVRGCLSGD